MDEHLDLNVYTHRGRPTNVEKRKSSRQLRKDLRELKKTMHYKDGTEILLAVSVATDSMCRHVAMYPEVMYLDVTANTNKFKRDLFLMVIKDSNNQTFIGNATMIPSGRRWVFMMIYKMFFRELYGETTLSRNRLCLTDNDEAEWGPLDEVIKTVPCWNGSRHMLCMFHALTLMYFKDIYPKLPHRGKGKNAKITKIGKSYGASSSVTYIYYVTSILFITYISNLTSNLLFTSEYYLHLFCPFLRLHLLWN